MSCEKSSHAVRLLPPVPAKVESTYRVLRSVSSSSFRDLRSWSRISRTVASSFRDVSTSLSS
jgi:hypothetical protein